MNILNTSRLKNTLWGEVKYKDFGQHFDVGNVHHRDTALYINISDKCPLDCHFCRNSIDDDYLKGNSKIMTTDVFKKVIDKSTDYGIWYYSLMCLFGEPFLDKDILTKLNYMEDHPVVKSFNIPSNIIPLKKSTFDEMSKLKKCLLKVSVYGHDEESYSNFTKKKNMFEKMYNNLSYIYEKMKNDNCNMKVTVMMKNQKFNNDYPKGKMSILLNKLNLLPNVRIDSYEVYTSNRTIVDEQLMAEVEVKKGICTRSIVGIVFPNGDVGFCSFCDIYRKHVMGNILTQSFKEIYENPNGPYSILHNNMKINLYNSVCSKCDFFSPITSEIEKKLKYLR